MKRSSKYDVFQPTINNNGFKGRTTKEKIRLIWKFIRVVFYVFLAAVALTGCIQSFVIRTNSVPGAGLEMYNSKANVAPYVNTFKVNTNKTKKIVYEYDEQTKKIIAKEKEVEVQGLEHLSKESFLASETTINELKSKLGDYENLYGKYNNYNSALRVLGINNKSISDTTKKGLEGSSINKELVGNDNGFLFVNNFILDEMVKKGMDYQAINKLSQIGLFTVARPNENTIDDKQKEYYGLGATNIQTAFKAYEVIDKNGNELKDPKEVKIKNGQYVTMDADWDGKNDSVDWVVIKDEDRLNNFKYAFNAEVATLDVNDNLFISQKFAHDYLQSLMNLVVQFDQLDTFFAKLSNQSSFDKDPTSRIKLLSKDSLEKITYKNFVSSDVIDKQKLLNKVEMQSILEYQNQVISLMKNVGFGIKKQVYTNTDSEDFANWTDPLKIVFMPNRKDIKGLVANSSPDAQQTITSWGEAWGFGPFYGLFVWPIAYMTNGIIDPMPKLAGWSALFSIVTVVIITRIITTLLSYKSVFASHKQQLLTPKKAKIDAKYEGYKGNRQMEARKRQELSELYKKNGVNMMAPMVSMLLTMPIFLAVWRAVQAVPEIKSATWLSIQFSATSWRELFAGQFQYLPLMLVAAGVQILAQILPRILNRRRMSERTTAQEKAALKKSNKMNNIMLIMFVGMAVIFQASVQIYWIVGGLWQIFQTLSIHWIVKTDFYKTKLYKYV